MRAIHFLPEASSIQSLQRRVITWVEKTTDPELLEKIYQSLEGTGLGARIRKALGNDADASQQI